MSPSMPCACAHLPISISSSVTRAAGYGLAVADDERLRDELRGLEVVLEVLRGDVLTACSDDDVLLAVGDRDEAVGVDLRDVARVEPAVGVEHGRGRLGILVVAPRRRCRCDRSSSPSSCEAELESGQRRSDGAEAPARGRVRRRCRRALAQAVALEDPDPDRVEELGDLLHERRTARDRRPQPAAEAGPDLRRARACRPGGASSCSDAPTGVTRRLELRRPRLRRRVTSPRGAASTPVVSSIAPTMAVWIFS